MAALRLAGPEDAPAIAETNVRAWREAYPGLLPADLLQGLRAGDREPSWRAVLAGGDDPHDAAVWEEAGEVAGFAAVRPSRDERLLGQGLDGEVRAIYVLRRWQGQGVGRSLLTWAGRALLARGHGGVGLWTLAGNAPARAFYERMGGRLALGETRFEIARASVAQVAYGWASAATLASSTAAAASANIGVGSSQ